MIASAPRLIISTHIFVPLDTSARNAHLVHESHDLHALLDVRGRVLRVLEDRDDLRDGPLLPFEACLVFWLESRGVCGHVRGELTEEHDKEHFIASMEGNTVYLLMEFLQWLV